VHPISKNQVTSKRVRYKFLCMVFQAILSKFPCATFQKPSTTSHFVPLFLAHEDVVVGFVIFHTKLTTPRLVSWEFRDSSHGEAYRRGSTLVTMGPARDYANRDTSVYPGSGPSWLEVNPYFLPASY
jgi:hypothetical protein